MFNKYTNTLINILAALLLICIFISLGLWQLDRYESKKNLLHKLSNSMPHAITDNEQLNSSLDKLLYENLILQGSFDDKKTLLLDNQLHNGKYGYEVFKVYTTSDKQKKVLVNLGWIAAPNNSRSIEPEACLLSNDDKLYGMFKETYPNKMSKQGIEEFESFYRIQKLEIADLQSLYKVELIPYIFKLNSKSKIKHCIITSNKAIAKPEKHLGYAVQWFCFALITFVFSIVRIKNIIYSRKSR